MYSIQSLRNQLKNIDQVENRPIDCVEQVGLGVAVGAVLSSVSLISRLVASNMGLVSGYDRAATIRENISQYTPLFCKPFNTEALSGASCYVQELVKQWNEHYANPKDQHSITSFKIEKLISNVLTDPIISGTLFQGLIQDVALYRIPKYAISKLDPGKETLLDSTISKVARIALTGALFYALTSVDSSPLLNTTFLQEPYFRSHSFRTLTLGIGYSILKETRLGFLGSITSHIFNNTVQNSDILFGC